MKGYILRVVWSKGGRGGVGGGGEDRRGGRNRGIKTHFERDNDRPERKIVRRKQRV